MALTLAWPVVPEFHGARRIGWLLLSVVALVVPLAGCVTNPTTGRTSLSVMSREEEVQMGQQLGPEFSQQNGGEVSDPELRAYVNEVGTKLLGGIVEEDKSLPWKFTLLSSDVINAFALPGGQVYFSMGLGRLMTNEAQMAGVIGHEIGHVTARHINERMGDQLTANILSSIVGIGLGSTAGDLASQAAAVSLLSFSRGQESEADYLGMKYMMAQGYDPAAQGQVMQILADASKADGSPPEFLSTHPNPETRVREVADRLKTEEFAHTQNNKAFQLYPERFQQRFLSRVPKAQGFGPALPVGVAKLEPGTEEGVGRRFMLGVPATWCALCRAESAHAPAP